nr:YSIRK-type signal peptide-containing protein [Staphylococcus haemolyticus]
MKKKSNKRLDFLPNINNKYSIRKFTVGTASILVGATLIFGAGHEAQAAENTTDAINATEDSNSANKPTATEQPSTEEKTTTEQPSTEEEATTEPSTEGKTTTEQPSTEEKATTEQPSTEGKATTEQPSTEGKTTTEQP